jgi:imidazoleglycerol phosphate dehydratase HisB
MESIFKALGFAIRQAVAKEGTGIPSTKGVI